MVGGFCVPVLACGVLDVCPTMWGMDTPPKPRTRVLTATDLDETYLANRTGTVLANDTVVEGATLGIPAIGLDRPTPDVVWVWIDPEDGNPIPALKDVNAFRLSELTSIEDEEPPSE